MNKKVVGAVLSLILLSLVAGYALAQLPSQTAEIPEGTQPSTNSITIFDDDSYIYAKNDSGEIVYNSTGFSTIVQLAINALVEGGNIYINAGTYVLSNTIYLNRSYVQIHGAGTYATWIELDDNVDETMIVIGHPAEHLMFNGLFDLSLHGNKHNQTNGNGIRITGYRVSDLSLERIICMSNKANSLLIQSQNGAVDGSGARIWNVWILDSLFEYADASGINIDANINRGPITQVWIQNCYLLKNKGYGLVVQGGDDDYVRYLEVSNVHVRGNGDGGIRIRPASYVTISNPHVADNIGEGIHISGVANFSSNSIQIIGGCSRNVDTADQTYGITVPENADNYTIIGVDVSENSFESISIGAGSDIIVDDNLGYVTENIGSDIIRDSTTVTFKHGLSATPTHVEVGWNDLSYGTWKWSATSKEITITVTHKGTYNFSWRAEFKP